MVKLPTLMSNPYEILSKFIKWEIMDLEAMIEAVESKNEMTRRRGLITTGMTKDNRELFKLQNTNKRFMTKNQKVNRITLINERIEQAGREIEATEILNRITLLYLNDVAIPFFQKDKLGFYNGAMTMFAQKQVNNCLQIANFYQEIIDLNKVEGEETEQ